MESSPLVKLQGSLPILTSQSIAFWSTSFSIFTTYLIFFESRLYNVTVPSRLGTNANASALVRSIRTVVTVLLGVHCTLVARRLLYPPRNLFTYFDLPISTPTPVLRATLKKHLFQYELTLPLSLEILLTRLTSLEGRLTYLKYGPTPLTTCPTPLCTTQTDFAFYAFPGSMLTYLTTLIMCSLLAAQSTFGRENWRRPVMLILGCCAVSEWWWCLNGTISVEGEDGGGRVFGVTHTHIYVIRNIILFLLPLILHHLPPGSALSALPPFFIVKPSRVGGPQANNINANTDPIAALNTVVASTGSTLATLHALKLSRVAGSRNAELRERIADYYTTIERNAALVRDDPAMSEFARREGFGYKCSYENKTPVAEDDDSPTVENGTFSTDSTGNGNTNNDTHPNLELRNRAREIAQGAVKAYLLKAQTQTSADNR